ncbi:MAG: DUF1016 family protein [Planctomycetes bacterium]|nr:DUF1016 family protein [Planctomycetota bacterium]
MARKKDPLAGALVGLLLIGVPYALLCAVGSSVARVFGLRSPTREMMSAENALLGIFAILILVLLTVLLRRFARRRAGRYVLPSQLPTYVDAGTSVNLPIDFGGSTAANGSVVGGTFAREADLENFLVTNWDQLDFGAPLEFVAQQVRCGELGIIDVLGRDRVTRDYVVVELKKGQADDVVFGQLSRYMGGVKRDRATIEGVGVRGIIVARTISPKLRAAAAVNPKVSLRRYVYVSNGESRASLAQRLNCSPGDLLLLPGTGDQLWCMCGHENAPHARYCAKCGGPVGGSEDNLGQATAHAKGHGASGNVPLAVRTERTEHVSTSTGMDFARLKALLNQMARLDGGHGLAQRLEKDLRRSTGSSVSRSTVHHLSKWCHPQRWAEREQRMQPVAREVSRQLFGLVIGREI